MSLPAAAAQRVVSLLAVHGVVAALAVDQIAALVAEVVVMVIATEDLVGAVGPMMLSGWLVPLQTGPPPAQSMSAASASAAHISIGAVNSPAARATLLPAVIELPLSTSA